MKNLYFSPPLAARSPLNCPLLSPPDLAPCPSFLLGPLESLEPRDPLQSAIVAAPRCFPLDFPACITVLNHLDSLTELSQWLEQLAPRLNLSPRGLFRLQLMTEEAVTNIIQNAYGDDRGDDRGSDCGSDRGDDCGSDRGPDRGNCPTHMIQVSLSHCDREFTLTICDDGLFFDPLHHPRSAPPKTLDSAQQGGVGIQLIRHFSDGCMYQRCHDRNILKLMINDPLEG